MKRKYVSEDEKKAIPVKAYIPSSSSMGDIFNTI